MRKFLIGLVIAIILIAVVVLIVAYIMSSIHNQTMLEELKNWWTDYITPLFSSGNITYYTNLLIRK